MLAALVVLIGVALPAAPVVANALPVQRPGSAPGGLMVPYRAAGA